MGQEVGHPYVVVPIALYIRNEYGGPGGAYDVSSLEPSEDWREGTESFSEWAVGAPVDNGFIAEAKSSIAECIDKLAAHFSSIGAVVVPRLQDDAGDDLSPGIGIIVSATDEDLGAELVHFDAILPPAGRLRDLYVEIERNWSSSTCPQTLEEIFDAARRARNNPDCWVRPTSFTADRLPLDDENIDAWAERVCIPSDRLARLKIAWTQSGRNIQLFSHHSLAIRSRGGERINWLVPGLVRRSSITLLAGKGGTGKSTAMVELVSKIGLPPAEQAEFLGEEICRGSGLCAYITAEDSSDDEIGAIQEGLGFDPDAAALFTIYAGGKSLSECLSLLDTADDLDLLVVDPMTKFVRDENDASEISQAFDLINAFVHSRACAAIVVHHMKKDFKGGIAALRDAIRGSGVLVDRPRMVIGMTSRRDEVSEIGIVKRNVPPGNYEWGRLNEGRLFSRVAGGLAPAELPQAARGAAVDADVLDWIVSRIEKHNADGRVVRRTGTRSVYAMSDVKPAPYSRAKIDTGIAQLISAGRVVTTPDQTLIAQSPRAH